MEAFGEHDLPRTNLETFLIKKYFSVNINFFSSSNPAETLYDFGLLLISLYHSEGPLFLTDCKLSVKFHAKHLLVAVYCYLLNSLHTGKTIATKIPL